MTQAQSKVKSLDEFYSSGWMSINKPLEFSSFDVVRKLRKILSIKKIGHAGTLDPLATGILPIAFGCATKTIPYLVSSKKNINLQFYGVLKLKVMILKVLLLRSQSLYLLKPISSKLWMNLKANFIKSHQSFLQLKWMVKEHIN